MQTESAITSEYAIVLSKNEAIVQVRIFNEDRPEVIRHAKAFMSTKAEWYDKVSVLKTINHIDDLSKNSKGEI